MTAKLQNFLDIINEALSCNPPEYNEINIFEEKLINTGFDSQDIKMFFDKLRMDGVITKKDVMYAPIVPQPANRATLSSPRNELYQKPVFILKINRQKLEKINYSDSPNKNAESISEKSTNVKPYTEVKKEVGFFKFYKEGENIKIGGQRTRHFKFLQSLCIPHFGAEKTVEEVFEAIKNDKDLRNTLLTGFDSPQKKTRILTIIKNSCIKELQKIKKLKKIKYKFDNAKKRIWLELEE